MLAGVLIQEENEKRFVAIGVKDSKLLTKEIRERLFEQIKEIAENHKIITVGPDEVDTAVFGHTGMNLNRLEAAKTADILNALLPEKAIVDSPSNNIKSYTEYVREMLDRKSMKLIMEHKADLNYPIVGAASILAKVTRDAEIEKLKKNIGIDFGSGYLSDPKTVSFLNEFHELHGDIIRKSWTPYQDITRKKFQSTLEDFSKFVDIKNDDILKKLQALEQFGYKKVQTASSHEIARFKGECTVTAYMNGTILVQGNEKEKRKIEEFLGI